MYFSQFLNMDMYLLENEVSGIPPEFKSKPRNDISYFRKRMTAPPHKENKKYCECPVGQCISVICWLWLDSCDKCRVWVIQLISQPKTDDLEVVVVEVGSVMGQTCPANILAFNESLNASDWFPSLAVREPDREVVIYLFIKYTVQLRTDKSLGFILD